MKLPVALFLTGGCLAWIPVLGWVLAPVLMVVGAVWGIAAVVTGSARLKRLKCTSCKFTWRPTDPPRFQPR